MGALTRCLRCLPNSGSLSSGWSRRILLGGLVLGLFACLSDVATAAPPNAEPRDNNLSKTASWQWPVVAIYEQQLLSYLDQQQVSEELQGRVDEYWQQSREAVRGPAFMDRLLTVAGLIEPRIAELESHWDQAGATPVVPGDLPWLTSDVPGWLQDTIRLACGRNLAQRRMYDEALETLSGLQLAEVCDPASLLFYRATSEHHLLKREECLANVQLLLERDAELPTRFSQLAHLMDADIKPLERDSLDEVARLMNDVERRLDLGRAGTRVRDEEKQIVDKLDKLIEKIEQQLQEMQQQQQQQSGQPGPSQLSPMDESQIAGGSGPGDVDRKDIGERAGWGNLPPAERKQALQRLTEELPSHYREVIEGYFRQLAKDDR